MKQYIITFYSHFEAMHLKRDFTARAITVTLSPVPRELSSSCGTCARFSCTGSPPEIQQEFEQLVLCLPEGFLSVIDNR